jgi:hypothetical protein
MTTPPNSWERLRAQRAARRPALACDCPQCCPQFLAELETRLARAVTKRTDGTGSPDARRSTAASDRG